MTPEDLVADLTYINYTVNRKRSPEISVERWRKVYGPRTDSMEARYQSEALKEVE